MCSQRLVVVEKVVKLNGDDVVFMHPSNSPIEDIPTFKVKDAIDEMVGKLQLHSLSWTETGMECEAIGSNSGGWKKGKVRLCLEFIPDEPDPEPEPKAPESPLDDLRQQVNQLNAPSSD